MDLSPFRLWAWAFFSSWLDLDLLLSSEGLDSSFSVTIKTVIFLILNTFHKEGAQICGVTRHTLRKPLYSAVNYRFLICSKTHVKEKTDSNDHKLPHTFMALTKVQTSRYCRCDVVNVETGNVFRLPLFQMTCALLSLMAKKMTTTRRPKIRHVTRKTSNDELPLACMTGSLLLSGFKHKVLCLVQQNYHMQKAWAVMSFTFYTSV